ncbi:MAG: hypothetical protein FWG10_02700 [Eubacteriaceae bacterium]|nr:hypothetical protein [Eubacteriaceae bacterium]
MMKNKTIVMAALCVCLASCLFSAPVLARSPDYPGDMDFGYISETMANFVNESYASLIHQDFSVDLHEK